MLAPRHEIAFLQSDFYREKFRKTVRWLFVSLFIIFMLIGYIVYLILVEPPQTYFANTTEGKMMPMPEARLGDA